MGKLSVFAVGNAARGMLPQDGEPTVVLRGDRDGVREAAALLYREVRVVDAAGVKAETTTLPASTADDGSLERVEAAVRSGDLSRAEADVLLERGLQIQKWGVTHDDAHDHGEIAINAAVLAADGTDASVDHPDRETSSPYDPWGLVAKYGYGGTKPNRRRSLVIAAALLIAEIERMDRAEDAKR